jgi:hypothetical protein
VDVAGLGDALASALGLGAVLVLDADLRLSFL